MIFVTVGNAKQGFRRLLNAVDDLARQGQFDGGEVFVQSGNNIYFKPLYCNHKPFLSMEEFDQCIKKASLIICHAGCGTLLHALKAGKTPVVMPRRKKYGEHVNDHQVELMQALAEQGRVVTAFEPKDLPRAISEAQKQSVVVRSAEEAPMFDIVRKAIKELTGAS
jgi:beta-1,4-N-acetylglucosaminyltransferase